MASALEVIKKFMYSLDNTNESGVSALDDAVNYASNGKFTSMGDLVNSYINDLSAYGSDSYWEADSSTFLREKCGILLDNSDTGAITGSDAGGTTEKTAESVVPESGSTSYLSYPTSASSTFNGLTIYWPDAWSLTDSQQAVVSRLNQWWMSGALGLVQESFDMNFREYGTTVNTIGLNFYNSYDNVLASVGYSYNPYNGEASELTLNINMYYYDSLDYNDVNGKAADTSAYLDRTLAHELTHAVMAANIDYFVSLPTFVKEGLAELVHGIDDEREYTIRSLAQADKVSRMRDYVFNLTQYYNCGEDSYAGGYMLFRYFAKQASTSYDEEESDLPLNADYEDAEKAIVRLFEEFTGTFDSSWYESTIRTVDARNDLTIVGNANDNLLKAGSGSTELYGQTGNDTLVGGTGEDYLEGGSGNDSLLGNAGNDTLYGGAGNDILTGGAGADVFRYRNGDGNDTIRSFESNKDIIDLYDADYTWSRVGSTSDVKLTIGRGSILLKGAWQKTAKIKDRYGKTASVKFTESTPVMPSFDNIIKGTELSDNLRDAWGSNSNELFYGYGGNDTLWSYGGNDYMDGGAGNDDISVDWESREIGNCTLIGGAGNDCLCAGEGHDDLDGGTGGDVLVAGRCSSLHGGAGNDSMYDYGSGSHIFRGGTGDDYMECEGADRFVYAAGDGNDTIYSCGPIWNGSNKQWNDENIIDLIGVDYTISCENDDVLITLGTGSIRLKYSAGDTIQINDRYGKLQSIDTKNLSDSSSLLQATSAKLVEDTGASYVAPETWNLDSSVDSIRAEREAAFAAKPVVMAPDASLGGSMALAYGNGGSQREGNEQNRFA